MKLALQQQVSLYNRLATKVGDTPLTEYDIKALDNAQVVSIPMADELTEKMLPTRTGKLLEASNDLKRHLRLMTKPSITEEAIKISTNKLGILIEVLEVTLSTPKARVELLTELKDELKDIYKNRTDITFADYMAIRERIADYTEQAVSPTATPPPISKHPHLEETDSDMEEDTLTDETQKTALAKDLATELALDKTQIMSLGRNTLRALKKERGRLEQSLNPARRTLRCRVQDLPEPELQSLGYSTLVKRPENLPPGCEPSSLTLEPPSLLDVMASIAKPLIDDRPVSYSSDDEGTDIEDILDDDMEENEVFEENTAQDESLITQSLRSLQPSWRTAVEDIERDFTPEPEATPVELIDPEASFVPLRRRGEQIQGPRPDLSHLRQREALDVPTVLPLKDKQKKVVHNSWEKLFKTHFGVEAKKLPKYEQRHLETSFYHSCHVDKKPALEETLNRALSEHRSAAEAYLPSCSAYLHDKSARPLLVGHKLKESLKPLATAAGLPQAEQKTLNTACDLIEHQILPLLITSCYDGAKTLEPHKRYLQSTLETVKSLRPKFTAAYYHLMDTEGLLAACEVMTQVSQDLEFLERKLESQLTHIDTMIANDFSSEKQLTSSRKQIVRASIQALEAKHEELQEQLANPTSGNEDRLTQAASSNAIMLGQFRDELEALEATTPAPAMVEDIVGKVKRSKKTAVERLKTVNLGKSDFQKGLQKTVKNTPWPVLTKEVVMKHNGEYKVFVVENIPASSCTWDSEQGKLVVGQSGDSNVLGLQGGCYSSLDKAEEGHALNPWVVRVSDPQTGEIIMTKVRTGVPVPFPMIPAGRPDSEIIDATCKRMKDTITLMLLNNPKFAEQVERGREINFSGGHNSLLSPDMLRRVVNAISKVGGQPFHNKVGNKLENELMMNRYIKDALKKLNKEKFTLEFKAKDGTPRQVTINYRGVMSACPANNMAQSALFAVKGACDPVNKEYALDMFGGTEHKEELGGIVGKYLDRVNLPEEAELVERASRQIQCILKEGLHYKDQKIAVMLASLINELNQFVLDGTHDFCKSGKDRTGYVNMMCIVTALEAHMSGNKTLPALDAPVEDEHHFNIQSSYACSGQMEIIAANFMVPGAKVDSDSAGAGDVYLRGHHKNKKYAKRVGKEEPVY